jgi:CHAT domain-containing protein/tetratricopeptide (TPR) repeat protein
LSPTPLVALLSGLALVLRAQEARPRPSDALDAGQRIERTIAVGEIHRYRVAVARGQLVRIVVAPRNVDVALALLDSDGDSLVVRDEQGDEPSGPEVLSYVADAADTLTVTVRIVETRRRSGAYAVALTVRSASSRDEIAVRAEQRAQMARRATGQSTDSLRRAAREYGDVIAMWRAAQDSISLSRALIALGRTLGGTEQLDSATAVLTHARTSCASLGDSICVADASRALGEIEFKRSDYPRALDDLRRSVRLAIRADDSMRHAWSAKLLGQTYLATGEIARAVAALEGAQVLFRALDHQPGEGATLDRLAVAYRAMHQYERALAAHGAVLEISRARRDRDLEMATENNVAVLLVQLGRLREAVDAYGRALVLADSLKNPRARATLLNNMAAAQARTNPAVALARYDSALALRVRLRDAAGEANTRANRGTLLQRLGRLAEAETDLDSSLALLRLIGDRPHRAVVLATLGKVYAASGNHEQSRRSFAAALATSDSAGDRRERAITLARMAEASHARGALHQARALIDESLAIWESLRRTVEASGLRGSVTALIEPDYALLVDVLAELSRGPPVDTSFARLALEAAERARARQLVDALTEVRERLRERTDASLAAEERVLATGLTAASREETRAAAAGDSVRARRARRGIDSLLTAADMLRARVRRADPEYGLVDDPPAVPIATIQSELLDTNTILLEYMLGERRSHLWVVTRTSITTHALPPRAELDALVRRYVDQLTARHIRSPGESIVAWRGRIAAADRSVRESAARLSAILLAPARRQLARRRILVAPAGSLQYVPFAALPDPAHSAAPNPPPLVVDHEIAILPSASAGVLLRNRTGRQRDPSKVIAVLADPVFDAADPRIRRSANLPVDRRESAPLARLEHTREEAAVIRSLVAPARRTIALDFDANLALATSAGLGDHRIIHIASHALPNDRRPELSAIALSAVDPRGTAIDGMLHLHQLYSLALPVELVVLSACESAIGDDMVGEGMVSLARGFMHAGARSVVASLWTVGDRATAELMRRFYQNMLGPRRMSAAAALRQAQISLWREAPTQAPFHWAAFALFGDAGPVQ